MQIAGVARRAQPNYRGPGGRAGGVGWGNSKGFGPLTYFHHSLSAASMAAIAPVGCLTVRVPALYTCSILDDCPVAAGRTAQNGKAAQSASGRMTMATTADTLVFEVSDAAPRIGAIIRADKQTLLSGERAKEIREIMERRGVMVFPEIDLTTRSRSPSPIRSAPSPANERTAPGGKGRGLSDHDGRRSTQRRIPQGRVLLAYRRHHARGADPRLDHERQRLSPTAANPVLQHLRRLGRPVRVGEGGARRPAGRSTRWALAALRESRAELERAAQAWQGARQPCRWCGPTARAASRWCSAATALHVEGMDPPERPRCSAVARLGHPAAVRLPSQWRVGDMVIWDNSGRCTERHLRSR